MTEPPASHDPQEPPLYNASQDYYVVSMSKFTLLFFATGGLYTTYWFYKNWYARELARGGPKGGVTTFYSILVALFSPPFIHALFMGVSYQERQKGLSYQWNPVALAWGAIAVFFLSIVLQFRNMEQAELDWFGVLASYPLQLALFYVLYKVQLVVNRLYGDPFGKVNSKLSEGNLFLIVFGFVYQVMMLYTFYNRSTILEAIPAG